MAVRVFLLPAVAVNHSLSPQLTLIYETLRGVWLWACSTHSPARQHSSNISLSLSYFIEDIQPLVTVRVRVTLSNWWGCRLNSEEI